MAVKLRLTRFGRLNHPTYRVCAADSRSKRDGRVIETLGYYLPKAPREQDQLSLVAERILHWLSVGAQPSETVAGLIRRAGIEVPAKVRKPRPTRSARNKSKQVVPEFAPPRRLGKGRLAKKKWRAKHAVAKSGS